MGREAQRRWAGTPSTPGWEDLSPGVGFASYRVRALNPRPPHTSARSALPLPPSCPPRAASEVNSLFLAPGGLQCGSDSGCS